MNPAEHLASLDSGHLSDNKKKDRFDKVVCTCKRTTGASLSPRYKTVVSRLSDNTTLRYLTTHRFSPFWLDSFGVSSSPVIPLRHAVIDILLACGVLPACLRGSCLRTHNDVSPHSLLLGYFSLSQISVPLYPTLVLACTSHDKRFGRTKGDGPASLDVG